MAEYDEKNKGTIAEKNLESNDLDYDAQKLQELGYKQEFKREISLFVQIGFAFTTMAVLPNWMLGFGPSINGGGPSSLFWGWIVVSPFVFCIALCMAEIISAYPLEGGVFSWTLLLSNKKWGPFMSYITGYLFLTGCVTGGMSLTYSVASFIIYISNTLNEVQITSQGATIGLYCAIIAIATGYNFFGMQYCGYLNTFMVFWVSIGTIIIICTIPAMAPKLNSAKWVFTEFTNNTGYESVIMVFFVGMLQAGWCLSGYVCGAQIVEGTKRADVTAPRCVIICLIGVIVQGLIIILVTLFSIQDINEILESEMPISTFFLRATNNPQLTAFFLFILLVAQSGSLCNLLLATSHFVFALARDGCIPFSNYFSKLSKNNKVPERALIAQLVISILLIMPNFGSPIYWQALMGVCIISTNISYGMPFLCRLIWVRNDMSRGPFSLGRFGLTLNVISLLWIVFFSIILCIPSVSPVTPETMNWASLMIGVVMLFSLFFWFISGRKNYGRKINDTEK